MIYGANFGVSTYVMLDTWGVAYPNPGYPTSVAGNAGTSALAFTVPANTALGSHTIQVGNKGSSFGASNSVTLNVTAASAPVITSLSPSSGPVGTTIIINGSGFTSSDNQVVLDYLGTGNDPNFNLRSSDGKTLVFVLPAFVRPVCQVGMMCIDDITMISPRTYNLSVKNAAGTSNSVTLTVTAASASTASLTVSRGSNDPASANIIAGATNVFVGEFAFSAQNAAYTVTNLPVLFPDGAGSSIVNVTLKYKDVNGVTQTVVAPVMSNPTTQSGIASFAGLTMYVPANDSSKLAIYIDTTTIASGATSGAAINAKLDLGGASAVFRAVDSAGRSITQVNSGTPITAGGTFYIRKSIPTFAMQAVTNLIPATGNPLYKFTVTASSAGAIEWSRLVFNIQTAGTASVSNVYLVDEASGLSLIDAPVTTAKNGVPMDLTQNVSLAKYQQIAAGATKTYGLYGTVLGFTTGSSIAINIIPDTSLPVNAPATSVAGSLTWSDRSSFNHSMNSSDWTNGYLIKDFAGTATYTKGSTSMTPTITSVSPSQGTTNTTFTIYGSNLGAMTNVNFYDSATGSQLYGSLISPAVSSVSDTSMQFSLPASFMGMIGAGTYKIAAANGATKSNLLQFTVTAPSTATPSISSTYSKTTLTSATDTLTFSVTGLSYDNAAGCLTVLVHPTASAVSPATACSQPSQFTYFKNNPNWNWNAATGVWTQTWSNATVPSIFVSGVQVQSTFRNMTTGETAKGQVVSVSLTQPAIAPPTITSLSPSSGPVGTKVQIFGSGFLTQAPGCTNNTALSCTTGGSLNTIYFNGMGIAQVSYNTTSGEVDFVIPNSLNNCPAGAQCFVGPTEITPGTYPVYVTNANGTSNTVYFSVTQSPVSQKAVINASSGKANSPFTIAGVASPVGSTVVIALSGVPNAFGDTAASTVVQANGVWSMYFNFGLPAGSYPLTILANGATKNSSGKMTGTVLTTGTLTIAQDQPALPAAPVITSLSPSSGQVGTKVRILGSGFTQQEVGCNVEGTICNTTGSLNTIYFDNAAIAQVSYNTTSGEVDFSVPTSAGDPVGFGTHSVKVGNANGLSNSVSFTVTPPAMCDYPAPPLGCYYTQGTGYDPATSCGMVLQCADMTTSAFSAFKSAQTAVQTVAAAPATTDFSYMWTRDLQVGSPYVADVSALQMALAREGVYSGDVTGGFFSQTFTAVQAFQVKYGIAVTGFVGPDTRAKLNALY
jgi:hypothetical protein